MNDTAEKQNGSMTNGTVVLTVEGELTIQRAGELMSVLAASLDANEQVEIQFGEVSAVDLSFLQLLCAAHRTAEAQTKRFKVTEDAPDIFRQAVREAGLARHMGCHRDPHQECLWKER